jgi:tryptophan-rich sensory protein
VFTPPIPEPQVVKYKAATVVEFALLASAFRGVDALGTIPGFCIPPLFVFLSLRSRVLSPLPASRPNRSAQSGKATPVDVKRPSWTPPGIAFPIIWSTISLLRATSALLSWRACGRSLFCAPLLALALHLSVGDTWNCVTNVERRLGTSALGVLAVWGSVIAAVVFAYRATPVRCAPLEGTVALDAPIAAYLAPLPAVPPFFVPIPHRSSYLSSLSFSWLPRSPPQAAGLVLAPSALWISIATVLTWSIWAINTPRQPLLPRQGDGKSASFELPLFAQGKWQSPGPPKKK